MKYTEQDAFSRVAQARVASLVESRLTEAYLYGLRRYVSAWLEEIDQEIFAMKVEIRREA